MNNKRERGLTSESVESRCGLGQLLKSAVAAVELSWSGGGFAVDIAEPGFLYEERFVDGFES